jgi:hypothetical protein
MATVMSDLTAPVELGAECLLSATRVHVLPLLSFGAVSPLGLGIVASRAQCSCHYLSCNLWGAAEQLQAISTSCYYWSCGHRRGPEVATGQQRSYIHVQSVGPAHIQVELLGCTWGDTAPHQPPPAIIP